MPGAASGGKVIGDVEPVAHVATVCRHQRPARSCGRSPVRRTAVVHDRQYVDDVNTEGAGASDGRHGQRDGRALHFDVECVASGAVTVGAGLNRRRRSAQVRSPSPAAGVARTVLVTDRLDQHQVDRIVSVAPTALCHRQAGN